MKATGWSGWVMTAVLAMFLEVPAAAQQKPATTPSTNPAVKRVIVVSLEDHKLALVEDGKVKEIFAVAVGKPSTPSPVGTYSIRVRVSNPTYYHDGRVIAPGPENPVGTRWMGLSIRGYGIHGTNAPGSVGKAASHGCIRMRRADLERLFAEVQVGDTVELIGTNNQETAQNLWRWTQGARRRGAAGADSGEPRRTCGRASGDRGIDVRRPAMTWLDSIVSWVSAALLPLATLLLLEELTYGGLVRLLLALRPKSGRQASPNQQRGGGR